MFLIADENRRRNKLANSLRDVGYDVHEYMTGRELFIDKRYIPHLIQGVRFIDGVHEHHVKQQDAATPKNRTTHTETVA